MSLLSTLGSSDGSASTHQCAEIVRAWAEPGTPRPKGSPLATLPSRHGIPLSRLHTLDQVASITLYEAVNVPERRLWPPE